MTQEKMTKDQWKYSEHTYALADTGDYEGYVQFTNGKDILQSCGDEIEEEQLKQFCELLDLMPDLWSHKCDGLEFENSQLSQQLSAERERSGKLIGALNEYIVLLGEELDEIFFYANSHGWKSKRIEKGEELRQKIKQVASAYQDHTNP